MAKVIKKRGRPKGSKGTKNAVKKKTVKAKVSKKVSKKKVVKKAVKRGRPKGSKSSTTSKKVVKKVAKRGRPKGSGKKVEKKKEEEAYIPPKSYKVLGYCSCGLHISSKDLVSKMVYTCPRCDKRARTNKLTAENETIKVEPMSKKEYLSSTINSQFNDMPPMEDKGFDNIKVIED